MGFRLKLREPLPDGLKRVFREQVESALKLCRHPAKERGVTVPEVRKHLKKLRAALRLTVSEVGKSRHAREDRYVREIGRLVSDLRDSEAGTRRRTGFKMAAGRHNLEANLRHRRKDLQTRPTWTREDDQETAAGKFSCLAQARERPLVSVAHLAAT